MYTHSYTGLIILTTLFLIRLNFKTIYNGITVNFYNLVKCEVKILNGFDLIFNKGLTYPFCT